MKHRLTPEDMQIAQLVADGMTDAKIAEKFNLASKTIQRRRAWPEMAEYIAQIKGERHTAMSAPMLEKLSQMSKESASTTADVRFNFWIAAQRYDEIYQTSTNDFCRLKAVDSMVALFGVAKGPAEQFIDADVPPKAKFYRSEWMDDKPN